MAAGTTNKALLCFCLLMLITLSSARDLSPLLLEGGDDPGDSKSNWQCFRLWDNYCVKNKRCEDKCQGAEGKGHHHGHCELWTCVCCKKKGEDDAIVAPPPRNAQQQAVSTVTY